MRFIVMVAALLLTAPALAQEGDNEVGFVQEDTTSLRFPDAEVEGPDLVSGARVTVLVREEDRVRVRAGTSYGWVPASAIGPDKPADASGSPMSLDPEALRRLLEQTGGELPMVPPPSR